MQTRHTALTEAHSPDADRAGPDASADLPDWLGHILALLLLLARKWALATGRRGSRSQALPSWYYERPDLPFGSTQALAASVRGAFGNAIAWMCLRRGIGPGHQDWPELSRAIVAFGGSVQGFRPGLPACGLQWWENPEIIPGMTGMPTATPAATAMASVLSRQAVTDTPPERHVVPPAAAEPAVSPAPCRPRFARVAAGPPTGPPRGWDSRFCDACTTGASAWPAPLS